MSDEDAVVVKDCNGNVIEDGDTCQLTKDLDVKGCPLKLKRGEKVKNVRLVDGDPDNIEYRKGKTEIYIKTCFLKKV